mgnify:FL=1
MNLLELMGRIVVIYSVEKIKIINKNIELYEWFACVNEYDVLPIIQGFCKERIKGERLTCDDHIEKIQCEDALHLELIQGFWYYFQHGLHLANPVLLQENGLSLIDMDELFKELYLQVKLAWADKPDMYWDFERKYNIGALLSENHINSFFFTYYELSYELRNADSLSRRTLEKILKFINQIPYYSPHFTATHTSFEAFEDRNKQKSYFSTLRIATDFQQGHLTDTLLQFLFQYLNELYFYNFFKPQQYLDIEPNTDSMKEYELQQLDELYKVMQALFSALPQEQAYVYRYVKKQKSIQAVLNSLLFYNFLENNKRVKDGIVELKDDVLSSKGGNSQELYRHFFQFLKDEFELKGFKVDSDTTGKTIDKWKIILNSGAVDCIEITGAKVRANFFTHSKNLFGTRK